MQTLYILHKAFVDFKMIELRKVVKMTITTITGAINGKPLPTIFEITKENSPLGMVIKPMKRLMFLLHFITFVVIMEDNILPNTANKAE